MRHGHRVRLGGLALLVLGALLAHQAQRHADHARREAARTDAAYRVAPAPELLRAAAMGQQVLLADAMWLRAVLAYSDVLDDPDQEGVTWVRQMFLSVHVLDPGWRSVYVFGGSLLRSLDDIDGSDELFLAGHEVLPDDPYLPFSVAMNAYLYRDDAEAAHRWLDRAAALPGAPEWYRAAAAGIVRRSGDRAAAIRYLEEQLGILDDPQARAPVERRLRELRHDALSEQLTESLREHEARTGQVIQDLAAAADRLPPDPMGRGWTRSPDGRVRSIAVDEQREQELQRRARSVLMRARAP